MKLRNKKTGKIVKLEKILFKNAQTEDLLKWKTYEPNVNSLAKLYEEWEDYKPTAPYLKDEKKRKFVRDWAEINGIKVVIVCRTFNAWGVKNKTNGEPGDEEYMLAEILFRGDVPEELEIGEEYAIPELCGDK